MYENPMYEPPEIKKQKIYSYLLAIYCVCLIISNILAAKIFAVGDYTSPAGVILFPIVYILNDVMAEIYPIKQVRKGIWTAFLLNAFAVVCYNIAIILPAPVFYTNQDAFVAILSNSARVLIASFVAYLVGSNLNALIMHVMHKKSEKGLLLRCMTSTLVGETLDAAIFITIAFYGVMPTGVLLSMVLVQATAKVVYEFICFPLTRVVIEHFKKVISD